MPKYYLINILLLLLFSFCSLSQALNKEKIAILQKNFNSTNNGGPTTNQFGDLIFEKNNKTYWLTTYCSVVDVAQDYYRVFEIDFNSGAMKEVTKEMLGDFFLVGALNPPYYYEDVDNDGIKDILIFDHGKEIESLRGSWGDYNVFFKGTPTAFEKKELPTITTIKSYYHAHALSDFDQDGDLDIAFASDYIPAQIFLNDGKGNFSEQRINNLNGSFFNINNTWYNASSFGFKFTNLDSDKELELLITVSEQPIYLDYINGSWSPKLFGKSESFIFKKGIHIGVEQTLELPNVLTKKNDLFYRVSTFDVFQGGGGQMKWMTKMFMSKSAKIDSIYLIKNDFTLNRSFYYLDPKLVDLNFDGAPDLFFKEDIFWGNTGEKLHPINERIWLNDGNNNFNPSKLKFSDDANQLVYIFAKSDSLKKINILFSDRSMPLDKNGKNSQDIRYLYNRIDSLIYPKIEKHKITICKGATSKYNPAFVPVGLSIVKSSKLGSISVSNNLLTYTPNSSGSDTIRYHLKNDFFESTDYEIIYNVVNNPIAPTVTREGNTTLISSSLSGNQWYLDGSIIKGEVGQKINATINGLYSVKYTDANGCLSENSASLYGLITATGLSDKKVIISPNPFEQSIKIEFPEDFGPMVSAKIHDVKGVVVWEKESVRDAEIVDLSSLSVGNYVLNLTSQTSGQMSVVKISKQGR